MSEMEITAVNQAAKSRVADATWKLLPKSLLTITIKSTMRFLVYPTPNTSSERERGDPLESEHNEPSDTDQD